MGRGRCKGCIPWNKGKIGVQIAWNKGLTKETDTRVAKQGFKGHVHTQQTKDILSSKAKTQIRLPFKQSVKDKISKSKQGKILTNETKNKISSKSILRWSSLDYRIKMSLALTGVQRKSRSIESRLKMSNTLKRLYRDNPDFVRKLRHRQIPSYPENQLIMFNELYDLKLKYVGNGTLMIGTKNPDFVDSSGTKLIEIWGEHWHKGQDPNDRISYFSNYGYSCLIIWASELKDTICVISKIQKFVEA